MKKKMNSNGTKSLLFQYTQSTSFLIKYKPGWVEVLC